jgi:hypothetical protein
MYTGEISVCPKTMIPLLHQSEYYQITELTSKLKRMLKKDFLPKYVIEMLTVAVEYRMPGAITLASTSLAKNFDVVDWETAGDELNFLPFEVLKDVISNR